MTTTIYEPTGQAREYSALALNLHKGCNHQCKYCYVPIITHNDKFFTEQSVRKGIIEQLLEDAPKYAGTNRRVLLCFTSDPYQPIEPGLTRQALSILRDYDIPFQILTKAGMRAARGFDLYGKYDAFAATLTFLDPDVSREFEPNAALPAERIAALKAAKERGIYTWVSLEPVINPQSAIDIIKQTYPFVDHYKIGLMNHFKVGRDDETWERFGKAAIRLCQELRRGFWIKQSLAKYLGEFGYVNTDTRIVKRDEPTRIPAEKQEARLFQ
jgi:DNA repair photolyase